MSYNSDPKFVQTVLDALSGDHRLSFAERLSSGTVLAVMFVIAFPSAIGIGLASDISWPWSLAARLVGLGMACAGAVATLDHITERIVVTDAVFWRVSHVPGLSWCMPISAVQGVSLRWNRSALVLSLRTYGGQVRSLTLQPALIAALRPLAGLEP